MKPRRRLKLIFWDSCIFFAWIKDESWPDDIKKGIEQTLEHAYAGQLAIVTSSVTLAEVIQSQLSLDQKERYARVFNHPNLQLHDIDRRIAGKAGVIREAYDTRVFGENGQLVSGSCMSLGDSLQLATALHLNVKEFHTLDGSGRRNRLSLLSLNGNVAGAAIAILKPYYVAPPEHLTGPVPETTGGTQKSLFETERAKGELITEGQPQVSSTDAAGGSTDAPPPPAPDSVVTKPEESALGGVEQKLGQQASPPSETIVASREEANAEPSTTQPSAVATSAEVRGSDNGSPEDQADAEAAQKTGEDESR